MIYLDEKYSTARRVVQVKPDVIESEETQSNKEVFGSLFFLPDDGGWQGEGRLTTEGYFKKALMRNL